MDTLTTQIESPHREDVRAVLLRHLQLMRDNSPAESCHVMDADDLLGADVVLMGVRRDGVLLAVGGFRTLDADHAELKSMHTVSEARGQGVAQKLLTALFTKARAAGVTKVSLETGTAALFEPAHRLYTANGFTECLPFGDYRIDPLSVYLTRTL